MPTSDAQNKASRLHTIELLFWRNRERRFRTNELADILGVSADTIGRDINELSARHGGPLPLVSEGWSWYLPKDAIFEVLPLTPTLQEAVALYLAGRLLSQIHDERNNHVISALIKLIGAMPEAIAQHQQGIVDMARARQQDREDRTPIFEALALGWAKHRKVRLLYAPPQKRKFECLFSTYLLEPSGIGRTIYAIGDSTPPNALRIYKLERIEYAHVTEESFNVPGDFDGPTLLARAWGVMYGDDKPTEVRLRFSSRVIKRLKETLWHPSQQMKDTPEGCEWMAQIGDTLEIENWIRGWGADCEVLAPSELREKIIDDLRRSARIYGISLPQPVSPDEPDEDLFNSFFGG